MWVTQLAGKQLNKTPAMSQDSQNPLDQGRRFIISYFLADDMISVFETSARNSGIISGKFLEKTRIPKPGSTVDNPEYYGPADFAIGATVEGQSFAITSFSLSL